MHISISVIIPVFNRETTIVKCVNSILSQTHLPQEIVIVDDDCTDETVSIIKSLNNSLIKVIQNNHSKGAQGARNTGIKAAIGNWIAFIDSDDEWLPGKLEKQVSLIKKNKLDEFNVIQCLCYKVDKTNNIQEVWDIYRSQESILTGPGPMFQGLLTSKKALESINYLDENISSYQEWDTAINLAKICKYHWIKEPLFSYSLNSVDSSFNSHESRIEGLYQILSKNEHAIISTHGAIFFSKNITNLIIDAFHCGNNALQLKIINEANQKLQLSDKLFISVVIKLRLSKKTCELIHYFMKKPLFGTKHLLKKILSIKSLG
jgi:glycosyltransferase involved in cell wall biosynthesis